MGEKPGRAISRRRFLRVVGVSGGLLLLGRRNSFASSDIPALEFQQLGSSCASTQESLVESSGERRFISFEGNVITPNPCYNLNARLAAQNRKLTVVIMAEQEPGPCDLCIGNVRFSGKIINLKPGLYEVEFIFNIIKVVHEERIALKQITVSGDCPSEDSLAN